jgi:predicted transglutaminase-like cysteine proteinase
MPTIYSVVLKALTAVLFLLSIAFAVTATFEINDELLHQIKNKHGRQAEQRVIQWQKLLLSAKDLPEQEKLQRVNDFFNRNVFFVDDIIHWHTEDYWATPLEFLASGAGDCEDYSIAKYFTLKELGVDENKMRITYVKALKLNQAHMVLTYYSTPIAVPLVLDNLIPAIRPASRRSDLLPVYSFNGTGLWLAKSRGAGKRVGSSQRLSLWNELNKKILDNDF